ncbi:hypothetical protein KCP70_01890 [Salmonella enterica subsp. enterica]|nr:hypothetical protein KCP70_01890 [Salmonella enterica subsp. enterica]
MNVASWARHTSCCCCAGITSFLAPAPVTSLPSKPQFRAELAKRNAPTRRFAILLAGDNLQPQAGGVMDIQPITNASFLFLTRRRGRRNILVDRDAVKNADAPERAGCWHFVIVAAAGRQVSGQCLRLDNPDRVL